MTIFNAHMSSANQIDRPPSQVSITASDLLCRNVSGTITRAGLIGNIDVGLEYLESWLRGLGCVPLHNLMEDAATAEIARCQIWQWIKHGSKTAEGEIITKELIRQLLRAQVNEIRSALGESAFNARKYVLAIQLYERLLLSDRLEDFLTLIAYPHITTIAPAPQKKIVSKM